MKGIILAGGSGSRLFPITLAVSKQLVPVYDKPMIYYPLSSLMLAGIRDILIITRPEDKASFQQLLGDGSSMGISLTYEVQPKPEGLAQAFIIGKEFVGSDDCCLILGDNIFYGQGFTELLIEAVNATKNDMATIFAYTVNDPCRYGVVELDANRCPISIEEKPFKPKSDKAVVGIYFYPNDVLKVAATVKPSARGELEITDVNDYYLQNKRLRVAEFGRGFAWLDTGTIDSLKEAAGFVETIQKRQGLLVGSPEEVAYRRGFITAESLKQLAQPLINTDYGKSLQKIANGAI